MIRMLLERGVHGFEGRTAAKPYGLVRALSVCVCDSVFSFIYESICLFMGALSLFFARVFAYEPTSL